LQPGACDARIVVIRHALGEDRHGE
jgi:hypothetical protein